MSIAMIVRDPWIRPGWVRLITEAVAAAQTADSTVDGVAYQPVAKGPAAFDGRCIP